MFNRLFAAFILIFSCVQVIALPLSSFSSWSYATKWTLLRAGFIHYEDNERWMAVFDGSTEKKLNLHAFWKDTSGDVQYSELVIKRPIKLRYFMDEENNPIQVYLSLNPKSDQRFIDVVTEATQPGPEWVSKTIEQLIIRHNGEAQRRKVKKFIDEQGTAKAIMEQVNQALGLKVPEKDKSESG